MRVMQSDGVKGRGGEGRTRKEGEDRRCKGMEIR